MKNRKIIISSGILVSILYSIFCISYSASAFEATSATFEIHAGDVESAVGSSTSATFKLHDAGGQNATASSSLTVTSVSSGILYWLHSFFTASYDQIHYRWRADDNTEALATFPVNLDTPYVSFPKNTVKRLRFEVSNEGWTRTGSRAFTLEVAQTATCSSGTYSAVPTNYSGHWHLATSSQPWFTDGDATSNVGGGLVDENRSFVPSQIKGLGNTTAPVSLTSSDFTEVEFGVMALNAAGTGGNDYCFRLTNSGAPSGPGYVFTYSRYAVASVTAGLSATGSLDSAVFDTFDGGGANQGPAYNSIMWNGTPVTDEGTGKVRFQLATSDCPNAGTNPPTCTPGAWSFFGSNDGGATCTSGLYYDTRLSTDNPAGGPGKPVEISCAASQSQNNKRYYKYRIQICSSADCTSQGQTSPVVRGVVVNWAP